MAELCEYNVIWEIFHELVTLKIMKHFTVSFLVSGWFGFGGQTQQAEQTTKQKPKVEPATSLPIR